MDPNKVIDGQNMDDEFLSELDFLLKPDVFSHHIKSFLLKYLPTLWPLFKVIMVLFHAVINELSRMGLVVFFYDVSASKSNVLHWFQTLPPLLELKFASAFVYTLFWHVWIRKVESLILQL